MRDVEIIISSKMGLLPPERTQLDREWGEGGREGGWRRGGEEGRGGGEGRRGGREGGWRRGGEEGREGGRAYQQVLCYLLEVLLPV